MNKAITIRLDYAGQATMLAMHLSRGLPVIALVLLRMARQAGQQLFTCPASQKCGIYWDVWLACRRERRVEALVQGSVCYVSTQPSMFYSTSLWPPLDFLAVLYTLKHDKVSTLTSLIVQASFLAMLYQTSG